MKITSEEKTLTKRTYTSTFPYACELLIFPLDVFAVFVFLYALIIIIFFSENVNVC